jgi:hypothetical protein
MEKILRLEQREPFNFIQTLHQQLLPKRNLKYQENKHTHAGALTEGHLRKSNLTI